MNMPCAVRRPGSRMWRGNTIKEMAADLPPEVVEAAYERGRQRDLFVTAAELLEEFKHMLPGIAIMRRRNYAFSHY